MESPWSNLTFANISVTPLMDRFHKLPHFNFQFERINNTFAPENKEYLESLVNFFWPLAALAVIVLLV
jgi:hypothetical protein